MQQVQERLHRKRRNGSAEAEGRRPATAKRSRRRRDVDHVEDARQEVGAVVVVVDSSLRGHVKKQPHPEASKIRPDRNRKIQPSSNLSTWSDAILIILLFNQL